jgi:hypothetical protein
MDEERVEKDCVTGVHGQQQQWLVFKSSDSVIEFVHPSLQILQ